MKLVKPLFWIICLLILLVPASEACRFWGAVGETIPQKVTVKQLLQEPQSLKFLGEKYDDGWSVGYYENSEPIIFRGVWASHKDKHYDRSVNDVAQMQAKVIFGHLRKASSGCVEGVPNPHPFERVKNGKTWTFGHNGGIRKEILTELIGAEYLKNNIPNTCTYDPPDSWVDSELYFIYLLKEIEANRFDVVAGLQEALKKLYAKIDEKNRYLNFFLSDGTTLWAFRKGNTLFYSYDEQQKISYVSSTVPGEKESWQEFQEDTIAVLTTSEAPEFIPIQEREKGVNDQQDS